MVASANPSTFGMFTSVSRTPTCVLHTENGQSLLPVTRFDDPVMRVSQHVACHKPEEHFVLGHQYDDWWLVQ
jgi:hypothetical protein